MSGAVVPGITVTLRSGAGAARTAISDRAGRFVFENVPDGPATLAVRVDAFQPVDLTVSAGQSDVLVTLLPGSLTERVTVEADFIGSAQTRSGTRTLTPLRDVPQAITVVTRAQIADLSMQSMADVVQYVPGVGMAQGEGHRDAPVLRGNTSTSDFFVDGIRDDVQYFRDLYNVDRVEALKGPNAMVFGRGGVGGVINRVTKQADWNRVREATIQFGSFDNRRLTADLGGAFSGTAAVRVSGLVEDSGSYRDSVSLERQGINPSLVFSLGSRTTLRAAYEYFHDRRTTDRGVPSFNGRPLQTDEATFFGDPDASYNRVHVNTASVTVDHVVAADLQLRNRTMVAGYDKFYQNVFPGAVNAAGTSVSLSGYNNATERTNVFSQTDLTVTRTIAGLRHRVLAGFEAGRQATDNVRMTAYFTGVSPTATSVTVPLTGTSVSLPVTFQPSASDANNSGVATVAAGYVQDQVRLGRFVELVGGIRYDRLQVDVVNNRTAQEFTSTDHLVSPRAGLIVKPFEPLSLYTSYSLSYLPRAGEQLSSLSVTNQALDPEVFRNYEVGLKWDVQAALAITAAVYRLDRGNVAVTDPGDPTRTLLVDGARSNGLELGLAGVVTSRWSVLGGYSYQDATITRTQSAAVRAGARLSQVPQHSVSLWNRYDVLERLGAGVGIVHRGEVFATTDNLVRLPRFTRVDAALFLDLGRYVRGQVNVENLFDERYYASAHNNNNITPGSPRALRVALTTRF
jgi:catecholate siderophore receptor